MNFDVAINPELESHQAISNTPKNRSANTGFDGDLQFGQESGLFEEPHSPNGKQRVFAGLEEVGEYSTHILELLSNKNGEEAFSAELETLQEAWQASYDGPLVGTKMQESFITAPTMASAQEVIIGTDDRIMIQNTRRFPFQAICQLVITAKDGSRYLGTGWLVSPRTVITAAHNVYLHKKNGWARSVEVNPGRHNNSKPFGSVRANSFRTVRGWVQRPDPNFDYAAIILPRNSRINIGNQYFRPVQATPQQIRGKLLNLSGYPGDKGGKTQWFHARPAIRMTDRRIFYKIDTYGGHSGSPVWISARDGNRYAVGIHAYGNKSGNSATRFIKPIYDNVMQWLRQGR